MLKSSINFNFIEQVTLKINANNSYGNLEICLQIVTLNRYSFTYISKAVLHSET